MEHFSEGNSYFTKLHTCRFFQETSEEDTWKLQTKIKPYQMFLIEAAVWWFFSQIFCTFKSDYFEVKWTCIERLIQLKKKSSKTKMVICWLHLSLMGSRIQMTGTKFRKNICLTILFTLTVFGTGTSLVENTDVWQLQWSGIPGFESGYLQISAGIIGAMSIIFDVLQRVTSHFFCNERPCL